MQRCSAPRTTSRSAAFCVSEPDAGSDVVADRPGRSTARPRTSGCSTAPRRGSPTGASPTSTWWWPPWTGAEGPRGKPRSSSRRIPRAVPGAEVPQARHPRLTHRRGRPRQRAVPGSMLIGGKERFDARSRGSGREEGRWSGRDEDVRDHPPRSAPRPSGWPGPPTSNALDYARERRSSSARRSATSRRSPSSSPT